MKAVRLAYERAGGWGEEMVSQQVDTRDAL